jgi:hypothetical protein
MTTPNASTSTSDLLSQLQTKISMPSLSQFVPKSASQSSSNQTNSATPETQSTTKIKTEIPICDSEKHIGVVTSGGDAPGMNAALMAIVRYSLTKGIQVYAIHEGYYGMAMGGKYIKKFTWEDTRGICEKVRK